MTSLAVEDHSDIDRMRVRYRRASLAAGALAERKDGQDETDLLVAGLDFAVEQHVEHRCEIVDILHVTNGHSHGLPRFSIGSLMKPNRQSRPYPDA